VVFDDSHRPEILSTHRIYRNLRESLFLLSKMAPTEPNLESISLSETTQPAGLDGKTPTMATAEWEKSKFIPETDRRSISKNTTLASDKLPRWTSKLSHSTSWVSSRRDTSSTSSRRSHIARAFAQDIWKLFATLGLFILRVQHGKLEPNWRHVNFSALIAILATLYEQA
jgi:hypothetical protein